MISQIVTTLIEYTPKDMQFELMLHKSLDGVLKNKLSKCRRKEMYLNEYSKGEYLVDTTDAELIDSDIWEVEENKKTGAYHCFRLFIKMKLSESSMKNAKRLND